MREALRVPGRSCTSRPHGRTRGAHRPLVQHGGRGRLLPPAAGWHHAAHRPDVPRPDHAGGRAPDARRPPPGGDRRPGHRPARRGGLRLYERRGPAGQCVRGRPHPPHRRGDRRAGGECRRLGPARHRRAGRAPGRRRHAVRRRPQREDPREPRGRPPRGRRRSRPRDHGEPRHRRGRPRADRRARRRALRRRRHRPALRLLHELPRARRPRAHRAGAGRPGRDQQLCRARRGAGPSGRGKRSVTDTLVAGDEPILVRPREPGEVKAPPPAGDARRFHASMPGYTPTPLRPAPSSARRLGVAEVLVKDESARLGLPSFKILGASWAVARALARRLGREDPPAFAELEAAADALRPLALSAATDGNHGRAVAKMAALLGLEARIYVPAGTAAARIDAIAAEGATVTVVDGGYDDAVRRSAQDEGDRCLVISDTSWAGYEDVPRWVIDGYATVFAEVEEQLGARPDVVVVPIGVGALAAATVGHFWGTAGDRPALVGVEPTSAACVLASMRAGAITTLDHPQHSMMAGLNCATP